MITICFSTEEMEKYFCQEPIKRNILIFDNSLENLKLWFIRLSDCGYMVQSGIINPMAIDIAFKTLLDVILLDILIPDLGSYRVSIKLNESKQNRHFLIIMVGALGDIADKIKAFLLGGEDYIIKLF
ncbi:response regulator [Rivularia sp. PCC 7116]|uniref:response regulator n=1 Tax=Rivularia sp. PCC 7116 TaxID=373994 RepID=UPI0002FEB165|nr:response regulator [Rivularia sp. PCC 7116]